MIIRIKKRIVKQAGFLLISLSIIISIFLGVSINTENVFAGNNTNETVIAKVNVSNTEPDLYKVRINHPLDSNGDVDLEAGNATIVICNGSFKDVNNYDDIQNVNATLYDISVASDATNNNNTHYTNSSCLVGGQSCVANPEDNQNGSCLCQFAVQYYVNPGSWQCNMTIMDDGGLSSSENSSYTTFNEILGIEIETTTLDFGNISVSQTSNPIRQNVTNVGNVPINISVRGYGGDDETIGQNLSMICDTTAGVSSANITFDYMRFDTINSTSYADMTNITNQTAQILNLTIPKRTNNTRLANDTNSTFWRLQIPLGAGGICNGTIVFGAIDASDD